MRRVLFIAYLYPPIANSGTRRSLSFANHLPDFGWEPVVLTLSDPPAETCDPALMAEVRPGTRIERAPTASRLLAARLAALAGPARRERVAQGLEWRLRALWQVPDEAASWHAPAVRRGVELHRELRFDAIYASGWPWTSFMVARSVAARTGCPFVVDYRDAWKSSGTVAWEEQTLLQSRLGGLFERRVGRQAAAVITVTPTLVGAVREANGASRVHLITNGFEPADFESDAKPVKDGTLRIAYTGVWRSGYGPDALYRAIRKLKDEGSPLLSRLKVIAAGFAPGPASELGVADVVEELGRVPHQRAVDIMKTADLLYLPVSEGFYANASLPGKLFEYLGSTTPILAAVPAASDVAKVLADVGGSARIEPGDIEALALFLRQLASDGMGNLISPRKPDRLQRYTRRSTTESLARVLDAVSAGASIELTS